MAGRRWKAVVDGGHEIEDIEADEHEDLELGLSLGRWGRFMGSSSSAGGEVEGWLSSFDLTVGSSRLLEDSVPRDDLGEGVEFEQVGSTDDKGRDCKRPKVLGFPL